MACRLLAWTANTFSMITYPMAYRWASHEVWHVRQDFSAKDKRQGFVHLIKARRQVISTYLHYYRFFSASKSICGGVLAAVGSLVKRVP